MRNAVLIGSIGLLVIAIVVYSVYNKEHRSVLEEDAMVVLAVDLFSEYETNEEAANTKYLDKAIEVTGGVAEIFDNQEGKPVIILATDNPMYGVQCTIVEEQEGIEIGTTVTIKGICTGFLSDVVITSGVVIDNSDQ